MHYIVYRTTCLINGKIYTGVHKTTNLNDGYLGSGKLFQRALKKYGEENFRRDILFECASEEEMYQKEKEVVTIGPGSYNLQPGGFGGWLYCNKSGANIYEGHEKQWEAVRHKGTLTFIEKLSSNSEFKKSFSESVSKSQKKRFETAPANFKGCSHTEETKRKIGTNSKLHQQGTKNSQYGTMWITNGSENLKILKSEEVPIGYKKGRSV